MQKFGWRAIPAYAVHVAQDFNTSAGIPLFPFARLVKVALQKCGLKSATATVAVTANLGTIIGAVGTALIVIEVGSLGYRLYVKAREKQRLPRRLTHTVAEASCVEPA